MRRLRLASPACRSMGAVVVLSMLAAAGPVRAAQLVFVVNSPLDAPDAAPGNGTCATAAATCTLRAAVQEATLQTANDVVVIAPPGLYRLTLASSGSGPCPDKAPTGDLDMRNFQARSIIIAGVLGATIIDGNGLDGVFDISSTTGSTTTLSNLIIRGGVRSKSCYPFGGGVHTFSAPGSPGAVTI